VARRVSDSQHACFYALRRRARHDDMTAEHEHGGDSRMRSRRTKSVTRAEEIKKAEQKVRRSQPDKP